MSEEDLKQKLHALGYPEIPACRVLPDGRYAWVQRFAFTHAILLADQRSIITGYHDRWCYESRAAAVAALLAWNPAADPEPDGWHRHPTSGRRREHGDREMEYVSL